MNSIFFFISLNNYKKNEKNNMNHFKRKIKPDLFCFEVKEYLALKKLQMLLQLSFIKFVRMRKEKRERKMKMKKKKD